MTGWTDRPSVRWLQLAPKVFALLAVLGGKYVVCSPAGGDCEHAVRASDINVALVVCRDEYLHTKDPHTGARLANLLRRSEDLTAARALATHLLATSAASDALQILGKILVTEHRLGEGQAMLEKARALHVAERRHGEIAVDDQALAGVHREQSRFAEALRTLDSCITESREAGDLRVEGYCHLSAGMVLAEVGYYAGAQEELDLADPLLELPRDRAWLVIERGTLELRNGFGAQRLMHLELAALQFERAIQYARSAALIAVQRKAELNLVFALAELGATQPGRAREATAHLEAARVRDVANRDVEERAMLQARIAYRRGNYALATTLNTEVFKKLRCDLHQQQIADHCLRIAVMQGEIGLATGALEDAITWSTAGVEVAEAMRGESSAIELRPWILSARRRPYELKFTALARARRMQEAVLAFDRWQGRTLLDQLSRGDAPSPATLRLSAIHADTLNRFVPALWRVPVMQVAKPEEILAALRGVELVALVVASDEIWRIHVNHGPIDIVDVAPLSELQSSINAFRAHPSKVALGEALGKKLLGPAVFRKTDETLFVMLDGEAGGEIAGLPVAALRMAGQPLISLRSIVHPARLSELGCVPVVKPRRSLVVADVRGDLPEARREALDLMVNHGFMVAIGQGARSRALLSVGPDDCLHLAVHGSVQPSGGALELHDRSVSALEISDHRGGPALAFLATCSSAAADDGELATSVATAFLASGSPRVIATLRQVRDSDAAAVTRAFYAAHGVEDPVRQLAHVQAELAKTDNEDWPSFVIYGHDICRRGPS